MPSIHNKYCDCADNIKHYHYRNKDTCYSAYTFDSAENNKRRDEHQRYSGEMSRYAECTFHRISNRV